MGVEEFLQQQSADGALESKGSFTLDLSKAADKLAEFALPSHSHYLLKIVQVAHHLRASKVEIKVERFRTVVRFKAPEGGGITDSEAIYRAFADPLVVRDPIMVDLISGLIGTITEQNLETLWSYSEGHAGRRVFINRERRFSIKDFTLSQPKDPDEHPYSFTLSVLHPRTWKFWQGARRRAAAVKVLEENCRYSGVKIRVDNREIDITPSHALNEHLSKREMIKSDGGYYWHQSAVANSNILYQMAAPREECFSILRPSLSGYVVRGDEYNVWASGTRVNNTLKPDGLSSAAWVLQFLEEGENVSVRSVPKRVRCQAVLGLNIANQGSHHPLRLKIIRSGVTVLEQEISEPADQLLPFLGCTLIIADSELESDLTGFQVIQNDAFIEKILSYRHLVPKAKAYFGAASELLTM